MLRPIGQNLASVAEAMALALISVALVAGVAPAADPVLRLRAFAVDPTGNTRARTQTLEIAIERWSTDEERQKILDALVERSSRRPRRCASRAGRSRSRTTASSRCGSRR